MKKNLLEILKYTSFIILGVLLSDLFTHDQKKNKIESILQIIEKNYVDSINLNSFYNNSINDIILNLDPHSSYIDAEKFNTVKEDMQGSFSGIGVQFSIINDTIVVVAPIAGGPSEKLGILSGDRIVYVDKELVANVKIKNEDVIKKLRGKKIKHLNGESQLQVIKLKERMILVEEGHQFGMCSVTQKVGLKMEIRVILHVITTINFLMI